MEGGQRRKWVILAAATWIQALTGTNLDFSSYSSELKSVMAISQLQLNYLSVASDVGKAFGWCSGVSLAYVPLSVVLLAAAVMSLFGYGLQWLVITRLLSLPYFMVSLLCLLCGCSISWFNTVCYVLCIKTFPENRPLSLSLALSYNGLTPAFYHLITAAINPSTTNSSSLYLLLNSLLPLTTTAVALPLLQPPPHHNQHQNHSPVFPSLYIIAASTGLYLLLLNKQSFNPLFSRLILAGALILLFLPLIIPQKMFFSTVNNEVELSEELVKTYYDSNEKEGFSEGNFLLRDCLAGLGEEHSAKMMAKRWDFWLYYAAYFCGGTIGLVYSNNLGQICQSLGYGLQTNSIVTLYSACSFFGRLLSTAPDFLRGKAYFARTGWLTLAIIPTPIAFLLLTSTTSKTGLSVATGLIGFSSGFIFSAALSITAELFGPNSAGINHNILITNIPIGSFFFGLLAAVSYDSNLDGLNRGNVCSGKKCYFSTFVWWGCISLLGLGSSFVLFLRTRYAYDRYGRKENRTRYSRQMSPFFYSGS